MKKLISTLTLLTVMIAPAVAQTFNNSYDNVPAYSQRQIPGDLPSRGGEGGGA